MAELVRQRRRDIVFNETQLRICIQLCQPTRHATNIAVGKGERNPIGRRDIAVPSVQRLDEVKTQEACAPGQQHTATRHAFEHVGERRAAVTRCRR